MNQLTQTVASKCEMLRRLYSEMLRIRMVEETIAARYGEQEMRCPVHLSIGQEGVAVGVCAALSPQDYAFSTHRSHAHYLAKGGSLASMIAELYGKEAGCCKGNGGSMHLIDIAAGFLAAAPIVGSTIPIAVGAAFGAAMRDEDKITVAFFGDGATEEGVFHESLNFAALKELPVLFICENNLYSVYSSLSVRQPAARDVVSLAQAHGLQSYRGDGNNVLDVYTLTSQVVSEMRANPRPVLLEFTTYRWREHCGPNYDNDIGYRAEKEFEEWKERCPIAAAGRELEEAGMLNDDEIKSIETRISVEIDAAFEFAKASQFPTQDALFEGVYA